MPMQQYEYFEAVLCALDEIHAHHQAAATIADRVLKRLVECGVPATNIVKYPHLNLDSNHNDADVLQINPMRFSVNWHGCNCVLGPCIQYKLLHRFSMRINHYCSYDNLMNEVWCRKCSDATIRSAVKRLRFALQQASMHDLAISIRGRGRCYGLFLDSIGNS